MAIIWTPGTISISGAVASDWIFYFSKALFVLHEKQGYQDITLDFSQAESVFGSFMAPAVVLCRSYMKKGVEFAVRLPSNDRLKSLFHNSNWSYFLAANPDDYLRSTFSGYLHVPAEIYRTSQEQHLAVNRIMDVIMGSLQVERKHLTALEWCINEVTDNVLNHAESSVGGIVQASTYTTKNAVEFVVADAGLGIRATLGGRDDIEALSSAIQEGVTRNNKTNQGNGLFGSFRVATMSGGHFEMHSGRASLIGHGTDAVWTNKQKTARFQGTIVTCQIVCNDDQLIEQAMVFRGHAYKPSFDYIDQVFEQGAENHLVLKMKEESSGFGSRDSGRVVRNKLMNLLRATTGQTIDVDFKDVLIVSSSFADEAIGKVFLDAGPMQFMRRVKIVNADRTIQALLDRAILQRSGQMTTDTESA
jgi:anti-sigma regulatory factor (Ser/Thr protein kinase)